MRNMRELVPCVYTGRCRVNESAVASYRAVAARLGSHLCTFHEQLGILHPSHLPPDLPQEHSALRYQKRKFAVIRGGGVARIFAAGAHPRA